MAYVVWAGAALVLWILATLPLAVFLGRLLAVRSAECGGAAPDHLGWRQVDGDRRGMGAATS